MSGKSDEIRKLRLDLADARRKLGEYIEASDSMGARIVCMQSVQEEQRFTLATVLAAQNHPCLHDKCGHESDSECFVKLVELVTSLAGAAKAILS